MSSKPHLQADNKAVQVLEDGRLIKIGPLGLNIVWGKDPRYWRLPQTTEDQGPAELIQVCWLEVTGAVEIKAGKEYEINFKVELAPDAFGWRDIKVFLMAKVGKKGKYKWTGVKLAQEPNAAGQSFFIPDSSGRFTITCPNDNSGDNTLHFGLYEVWSGKWKGGLKIHEANIKQV